MKLNTNSTDFFLWGFAKEITKKLILQHKSIKFHICYSTIRLQYTLKNIKEIFPLDASQPRPHARPGDGPGEEVGRHLFWESMNEKCIQHVEVNDWKSKRTGQTWRTSVYRKDPAEEDEGVNDDENQREMTLREFQLNQEGNQLEETILTMFS